MDNTFKKLTQTTISRLALVIFLAGLFPVLSSAEITENGFSKVYVDEGVDMTLQGTGIKSVAFIKAFKAGFYRGAQEREEVIWESPKRIEVEYFVNIPAQRMAKYTIKKMKVNTTEEEFQQIFPRVQNMETYFVDLKPGDRYSLTYIPGKGTKFAHNNQVTGIIEGSDFAKALFSVWIGDKPFDKRIKKQILGIDSSRDKNPDKLAMRAER